MPSTKPSNKEKATLSLQVTADVLEKLTATAKKEGRPVDALAKEALAAFVQGRKEPRIRPHVMQALKASISQHETLYQELAK